jgi:hypothetical protein
MTVISSTDLNAILLNNVRTTALNDAIRRNDFELVLMTFSEL